MTITCRIAEILHTSTVIIRHFTLNIHPYYIGFPYEQIHAFFPDIQIKVAKLLTFVFAIIMLLVTIGLCTQIEQEVSERKSFNITEETPLIQRLPAGVSTLYLGFLVAIFIITALLHPKEFLSLIHGFWYLLCLPSGYLLLTIYSIVNMTDRSWGELPWIIPSLLCYKSPAMESQIWLNEATESFMQYAPHRCTNRELHDYDDEF